MGQSREKDEQQLAMLRLTVQGYRTADIERRLGMADSTASVFLRRIRDDDIKHSGEDPAVVAAAYEKGRR